MSLEDDKSGVFSFSHSGAVLKFSSFLGLFKDEELSPLRYDGFLANANRTYRVVQLNLTPKISAADVTVKLGIALLNYLYPLRCENQLNRHLRTTHNDAFATNLAFVKTDCAGEQEGSGSKVGLLFNEKLIPIPGCEEELWCDYGVFKEAFRERTENCDFDAICDADNAAMSEVPVDDEDKF